MYVFQKSHTVEFFNNFKLHIQHLWYKGNRRSNWQPIMITDVQEELH